MIEIIVGASIPSVCIGFALVWDSRHRILWGTLLTLLIGGLIWWIGFGASYGAVK